MPRALLINPWIYDFAAFDLWASPLGLLQLGAILRLAGWDVDFVDALDRHHPCLQAPAHAEKPDGRGKYPSEKVEKPEVLRFVPRHWRRFGLPPAQIEQDLRALPAPPDLILVTSRMTYWYPGVAEAIALCRLIFPSTPIALGGIYATLCPEHAARVCRPDRLVTGEGEPQLPRLVEDLTGRTLHFAPGKTDADWSDPANWPPPAWDLQRSRSAIAFETSRGCPYRCTYCASERLVPKFRRKSPMQVADEVQWATQSLGAQDIAFYDDALLLTPERHFLPIAREMLRRGIHARFHTPNSLFANEITHEVAGALRAIGVETLRISLESASIERLAAWKRRVLPDDVRSALRNLRAAGFRPEQLGVYILLGLPGQTFEEVREAVELVMEEGATPRLAEFSPIPGTREWDVARERIGERLAQEPLLQNNTVFFRLAGGFTEAQVSALRQQHRGADAQSPRLR